MEEYGGYTRTASGCLGGRNNTDSGESENRRSGEQHVIPDSRVDNKGN